MKKHWTERSIKDYVFRIATDFITQLEKKIELLPISQDELAKRLGVTKGRVSQFLNHPGNFSLAKMVGYARTLGMKVSVVAYEDDDPENKKGPINSEIFQTCWEKSGKPRDFWAMQGIAKVDETVPTTAMQISSANIAVATTATQILYGNIAFPIPYYSIIQFAGNRTPNILEETLLPS